MSQSQCSCFNYSFIHFTRVLNVSLFAIQQMVTLWTIAHPSEQNWVKERKRERGKETDRIFGVVVLYFPLCSPLSSLTCLLSKKLSFHLSLLIS